jgi:hypothetical protein
MRIPLSAREMSFHLQQVRNLLILAMKGKKAKFSCLCIDRGRPREVCEKEIGYPRQEPYGGSSAT